MIEKIKEITGMPIHYYCEVNFIGIREIVDILGGVDYDVPMKMDYEDPEQDLYIHLEKGPQHLDGDKAEQLLRFRKGYANQDLGRINTQQGFIKEMFKQKMQPKYLLKAVDIIRCEQESAPRHLKFSMDGKYMYVVCELKNCIFVYSYTEEKGLPYFEKIQTIPTTANSEGQGIAASALTISEDGKYIIASNAGENSVAMYEIDSDNGELINRFCLPISGEYPKDACLFPDNKHLVSLNHESNTMTFFNVDLEKDIIVMNGKELEIKLRTQTLLYFQVRLTLHLILPVLPQDPMHPHLKHSLLLQFLHLKQKNRYV